MTLSKDCILHVLPLHHTHGLLNCLLTPLSVGAKVVMHNSFEQLKVWRTLTDAENEHRYRIIKNTHEMIY